MCSTSGPSATQIRTERGPQAARIRTTVGLDVSQAVPAMTFGSQSSGGHPQVEPKLGASPKRSDRMDLIPMLPPGRANRMALAYATAPESRKAVIDQRGAGVRDCSRCRCCLWAS